MNEKFWRQNNYYADFVKYAMDIEELMILDQIHDESHDFYLLIVTKYFPNILLNKRKI